MTSLRTQLFSLFLVALSFTYLRGQTHVNEYKHQRKDNVHILVNDDSVTFVFGDKRKDSIGNVVRTVMANNHRYDLIHTEIDHVGDVLKLRDTTNAIVGTMLLDERYNIVLSDGQKFLWRDRDYTWGYQKDKVYLISGDKRSEYVNHFTLNDTGNYPQVEVVRIFFMYRSLYEVRSSNYQAVGALNTLVRILTFIH